MLVFFFIHKSLLMKIDIKSYQGYLLLILAQLMVGICIVGSKALLQTIQPIIILTIRFIIGALFLFILHLLFDKEKIRPLKKLSRLDWIFIIAQAICAGALFNILLLMGLKYTSASVAGIITSALPAIVAIFSIIFLKERLTSHTAFCIGLAIAGLIIINAHSLHFDNSNHFFGDIIILISLIPEAAYYVLAKLHKNKLPIFLVSSLMNGINVPIFLFLAIFQHLTFPANFLMMQSFLLVIVGIGSAMFYVFWFLGCKRVHGTAAGLTTAFMPITTLIIAYVFLNERISISQLAGMFLVILSIIFNASKKPAAIIDKCARPR